MKISILKNKLSEKPRKKTPSKVFRAFRIAKNIIFGGLFVVLTCMLIVILMARVNGETPKLFGHAVYRVSSASMTPYLQVGDIILCQDCDPMTLKNGDIITYDGVSGQLAGRRVTHRVVKEPYLNPDDGKYYLVTKGDDNPIDDSPIETKQVIGKFVKKISFLKSIYDFFVTPWGLITIIALIIFAFSNEVYNLIRAAMGLNEEEEESIQDVIERLQNEDKASQDKEQPPE